MAPSPPQSWAKAPPYHYRGAQQPAAPAAEDESDAKPERYSKRSLLIDGLLDWMDEDYLHSCFTYSPELLSVEIKRNKEAGQSEGFAFLNFADNDTADLILQSYHGQKMPNTDRHFTLKWVTCTTPEKHTDDVRYIYVGDLGLDVTDFMLHHLFKSRYPSVKSAKVAWDSSAGCSKGYGFVKFGNVSEHRQAINEMNGAYCSTRRMRVEPATNKMHVTPATNKMHVTLATNKMPVEPATNKMHVTPATNKMPVEPATNKMHVTPATNKMRVEPAANKMHVTPATSKMHVSPATKKDDLRAQEADSDCIPNNKILFVGGLDLGVTDEDLNKAFSPYGEITDVRVIVGKNYGFVTYSSRASAEEAMRILNRSMLGDREIRINWGHRAAIKQDHITKSNPSRPRYSENTSTGNMSVARCSGIPVT